MSDIIHLLPDSIANQIAAGEVIQRPSSVIKELVENAIDAGASKIQVIVKDAGRTLIQVIDDGKGMSETDARMAFERHATSKIRTADDLFRLRTMGFRGEALASIAAIAHVELRTRREEDELGTLIEINGSEVLSQTKIACPRGANFAIKNLFYNVPARRKFLKADSTELRNLITDFQRIALVYPEIEFEFIHNDRLLHDLRACDYKQRILDVFGKSLNNQLLDIKEDSDIIKIHGFVGKPESARRQGALTYFFVNGRYMNHSYFHRAVMQAYDKVLPPDTKPNYFIYFEVNPAQIDVNVHPTKTEIKFENENAIWSILAAAVKESMGKFNVFSPMSFDSEVEMINNFVPSKEPVAPPKVSLNPNYNPFKSTPSVQNWEKLYEDVEKPSVVETPQEENAIEYEEETSLSDFFQIQKKYILRSTEAGIMLIDQRRAHLRVLFEENLRTIATQKGSSQTLLFPEILDLNPEDMPLLEAMRDDLRFLGFDLSDGGKNALQINAVPAVLEGANGAAVIEQMIDTQKNKSMDIKTDLHETIALALAKSTAIKSGQKLTAEEMSRLFNRLLNTSNPNYAPDGKAVIALIGNEEIERKLK
ncbi:DNA mismatch repair protein MutL [Bacteroidia bacterium]|nr:DNA mismatch repair protein MutL [Bacteroidia bacterium]